MDMRELEKTFLEYAKMCAEQIEKDKQRFIDNNPDEPVPEWYNQDFCINTALAAMCKAIAHLQGWRE